MPESSFHSNGHAMKPTIVRMNARDPKTTIEALVSVIERDGGVIVEDLITKEAVTQIAADLKPYCW